MTASKMVEASACRKTWIGLIDAFPPRRVRPPVDKRRMCAQFYRAFLSSDEVCDHWRKVAIGYSEAPTVEDMAL